jgi:beta-xylosidase
MKNKKNLTLLALLAGCAIHLAAQNPIIHNQFTADPTARVFNGKVYLFPSHDIKAPEGKNLRKDWFCMADYHVFSSENLTDWTDHGTIVSQNGVEWVDSTSYSMWAPDCVERNGKYYFYFPANTKHTDPNGRRGFGIGVAIADRPEGPYVPQKEPIAGVMGIDPNVFIDKDGQAYLIWSMGRISIAKLKDNMLELDSEPQEIKELPAKGLKEGPFMFERNGIYYMTYPHVENTIERLEYAMGNNPMGPFKFAGVIMDEAPNGCWTNHHSIINYKNQWYLFYHQNDWSPKFDKNRSVRIDSLFFNSDGTIQLDRYSRISDKGASVVYNDTLNYFDGWKTVFSEKNAWVEYNGVDFSDGNIQWVEIRYLSPKGTDLVIGQNGKTTGKIKIPASARWTTARVKVSAIASGVQNLLLTNAGNHPVEIDWISFK